MHQEDLSSPPPAYSQQEFDQKVSSALQVSLSTPQPQTNSEEQWEEWDDEMFRAAAEAISSLGNEESMASGSAQGAGSQRAHPPDKKGDNAQSPLLHHIEPLRIHKKPRYSSGQPKPRPSWFAEGEIDMQSSAGSSTVVHHDIPPDDEEDHSVPPPPFSAVAPSLDGRPVIVMAYQPSPDSRPPSPLNSPIRIPLEIPAQSHESMSSATSQDQLDQPRSCIDQLRPGNQALLRSHRPARQSLPSIPHQPHNAGQRPEAIPPSKPIQSTSIPHMSFNPHVAYGRNARAPELLSTQHPAQHFDPRGFYNSAVVAHLSTPSRIPARQSQLPSAPGGRQNMYHSSPRGYSSGHQSPHDAYTAAGSQVPGAPPGSRNGDPRPPGTPEMVYPINPYSQPSMDPRYSQNPQYRHG